MSQHKNKIMIGAIVIAIIVIYKMDWIKEKWYCVKNCYGSGKSSVSHMASIDQGRSSTDPTMDGSVAAASAQMAATNSGLGVTYQPSSANGMYALDGADGLASYNAASPGTATIADTISPLSPKDYNDSMAWLQSQQVQVQPELLPSNVSAAYTGLLSNVNFLTSGATEGAITRPVFRNSAQGQEFFRPQVLIAPDVNAGGGVSGSSFST